MRRRAVFLDRDGTLNAPVIRDGLPYPPNDLTELVLVEGVTAGCRALKDSGFFLIVVTNQPDVGRGTQTRENVEKIHRQLRAWLPLDRVEVCYASGEETPSDPRRKPSPGMLIDAAKELDLDLSTSWLIGDRWRDVDCGRAAGVKTIWIDWGYDENLRATPDHRVVSFTEAVEFILKAQ